MEPSVFAIIVTFNRPDVLRTCIESLLPEAPNGLQQIYVVINSQDVASRNLLEGYADSSTPISFVLLDNEGPAGGFHAGLKKFLESKMDFAWLMDDDIVVRKGCLKELVRCTNDHHSYVFPTVETSQGVELVSFGWWAVLLSKQVVEKAGLPLKELFYWAEDTEYLQNRIMRVHGIEPYRCTTAFVEHLHKRGLKRPSWYYYYATRNTFYYRTYLAGYTWYRFKRTVYLVPQEVYIILAKEDHKFRKLWLVVLGLFHGLAGRIGKRIDPKSNP